MPETVLTNDMLSAMVDTSDEWIVARTGIRERRIVKDEKALDLALAAAKAACQEASALGEFSISQIDLVICATLSSDIRCPSIASCLQRDLGLREDILAFDLNAACSGFIYALIVASRFVEAGSRVLIVGSETLSHFVDYTDRSTCILFGDGAGAAVVAPSLDGHFLAHESRLVGAGQGAPPVQDLHTEQGAHAAEEVPAQGSDFYWVAETHGDDELLLIDTTFHMDGSAVFKFAVEALLRSIRGVVKKADLELDQIDVFICHQANERIIRSAAKRLKLPLSRFFMNLAQYGNTSAASVPLALDEALKSGTVLHAGSRVVMAGFGGGLTAGAVCFTWE